jgi:hypothetical protein
MVFFAELRNPKITVFVATTTVLICESYVEAGRKEFVYAFMWALRQDKVVD